NPPRKEATWGHSGTRPLGERTTLVASYLSARPPRRVQRPPLGAPQRDVVRAPERFSRLFPRLRGSTAPLPPQAPSRIVPPPGRLQPPPAAPQGQRCSGRSPNACWSLRCNRAPIREKYPVAANRGELPSLFPGREQPPGLLHLVF